MMDDNKQLALRIDGALQAAGQEVTALRAELAATGRRLAELGSDPAMEHGPHGAQGGSRRGQGARGVRAATGVPPGRRLLSVLLFIVYFWGCPARPVGPWLRVPRWVRSRVVPCCGCCRRLARLQQPRHEEGPHRPKYSLPPTSSRRRHRHHPLCSHPLAAPRPGVLPGRLSPVIPRPQPVS